MSPLTHATRLHTAIPRVRKGECRYLHAGTLVNSDEGPGLSLPARAPCGSPRTNITTATTPPNSSVERPAENNDKKKAAAACRRRHYRKAHWPLAPCITLERRALPSARNCHASRARGWACQASPACLTQDVPVYPKTKICPRGNRAAPKSLSTATKKSSSQSRPPHSQIGAGTPSTYAAARHPLWMLTTTASGWC